MVFKLTNTNIFQIYLWYIDCSGISYGRFFPFTICLLDVVISYSDSVAKWIVNVFGM